MASSTSRVTGTAANTTDEANQPKSEEQTATTAKTNEGSPATDAQRDESPDTANPTVNPGDNIAPLGTLSYNTLPPNGTGFHCGICGRVVGKEGQHYDDDGDVTETPHANVSVVADDWAANQEKQDAEAGEKIRAKRARRTDSDVV